MQWDIVEQNLCGALQLWTVNSLLAPDLSMVKISTLRFQEAT